MNPKKFDSKEVLPSKWFLLVPFLFYLFQIFNFSQMDAQELLYVHLFLFFLGITFISVGLFTSRLRHKRLRLVLFVALTIIFALVFLTHNTR